MKIAMFNPKNPKCHSSQRHKNYNFCASPLLLPLPAAHTAGTGTLETNVAMFINKPHEILPGQRVKAKNLLKPHL